MILPASYYAETFNIYNTKENKTSKYAAEQDYEETSK